MNLLHLGIIFGAGCLAGIMNSIAGGGTLITFPALVWHGLPPVTANATNSFALWPGSLSAAWGYRHELGPGEKKYLRLLVPSLAGAIIGAILLRMTPDRLFARIIPFLVLLATLLFMAQEPMQRWLRSRRAEPPQTSVTDTAPTTRWTIQAWLAQFLTGIYGGYFGAGMGIIMLATLGMIGLTDIHKMNSVKNILGFCINFSAGLWLAYAGLVRWPEALVMMAGAIIGGYFSAGVAQRLGRQFARRAVIVIGFLLFALLLFKS
ncbi:MAG: sulfite exporter TauE/SafE family protein [Blastocatellia bacterium]